MLVLWSVVLIGFGLVVAHVVVVRFRFFPCSGVLFLFLFFGLILFWVVKLVILLGSVPVVLVNASVGGWLLLCFPGFVCWRYFFLIFSFVQFYVSMRLQCLLL